MIQPIVKGNAAVYDQNVGKRHSERESEESETGHKDGGSPWLDGGCGPPLALAQLYRRSVRPTQYVHIVETSGICSVAATMHASHNRRLRQSG